MLQEQVCRASSRRHVSKSEQSRHSHAPEHSHGDGSGAGSAHGQNDHPSEQLPQNPGRGQPSKPHPSIAHGQTEQPSDPHSSRKPLPNHPQRSHPSDPQLTERRVVQDPHETPQAAPQTQASHPETPRETPPIPSVAFEDRHLLHRHKYHTAAAARPHNKHPRGRSKKRDITDDAISHQTHQEYITELEGELRRLQGLAPSQDDLQPPHRKPHTSVSSGDAAYKYRLLERFYFR